MSDPLSPVPTSSEPRVLSLESLAEAHRSLRTAFHISLVMLLVLTGSLFVFFVREVSIARRQINELTKVVRDYEKTTVPMMEDFRIKLQSFTKTNPDFSPIFIKYFGNTNPPAASASGGGPAGPRLPPGR